MEEISPGVTSVTAEEAKEIVLGTERIVDYTAIGMSPYIEGPVFLTKELQSHAEFSQRAVCIAVVDTSSGGRLQKVFWYTGNHMFPKEYLEMAVDNKETVVIFANYPEEFTLEDVQSRLNFILPPTGCTPMYRDILWVRGSKMGSYMCEDTEDCCPKEGHDLNTIGEDNNA